MNVERFTAFVPSLALLLGALASNDVTALVGHLSGVLGANVLVNVAALV